MANTSVQVEEKSVSLDIRIPRPNSELQRLFVRSPKKRKIGKYGRRFGKTVAAAIMACEEFLGICRSCGRLGCETCNWTGVKEPGRVLYATPTAEQIGKFWFEVTEILKDGITKGIYKKDETERYIEREGTENRIKAKTAWNADTLRGDFVTLLILDEFQLMSENAWEEVGEPMLLDKNGDAVFLFTPPSLKGQGVNRADDPRHASKLYKKWFGVDDKYWQTFHGTSYDNPALAEEALSLLTRDMSMSSHRREILAEDDDIETSWQVYHRFNEDLCKIAPFPIPRTWPVITGHDFGAANPAALFLAQAQLPLPEKAPKYMRYGDYVVWKEYLPGGGYSATQHAEKFREITTNYKILYRIGGNFTTEGEIRQAYGMQGWPIIAPLVEKKNAQIDRVRNIMESGRLFIFENCYHLLSEIADCMWELDTDRRPTDKIRSESRYHALSALRYVCSVIPPTRLMPVAEEKRRIKVW